ncbi:NAD(P)-dependent oxidoreductase, partial [Escherichia coli]|uniref:NAD(P)-dependent oxidoreductase n=1 Tax=Escherichia coli TaxID=562 RepID=UPI002452B7D1
DWYCTDVPHKTLCIVGLGRIGLALPQRAHFPFTMPILYTPPPPHKQPHERFHARYCALDSLLPVSYPPLT